MKPKQYLAMIPDKNNLCTLLVSRQYTKEMAERDICLRLEEQGVMVGKRLYLREMIIDEDGVIRLVNEKGEILPLDTWKV